MAPPKVLIANRGEIAVRIARACRDLGWTAVAVYSDADRDAPHVQAADEAHHLGAAPASESYMNTERLIAAARRSTATFVHPGYGFLAESGSFARACADAGLTFIGPSPAAIELMGHKTAARQAAVEAGAPVVPGSDEPFGPDVSDRTIAAAAGAIGYPVLVKAVSGGGGKGMRTVVAGKNLASSVRAARSEAAAAFGDAAIYLERAIPAPRHIEIQLLGDHTGNIVPFVERECSIQRRHQKVVEESPSVVMTPEIRGQIAACAVRIARHARYTSAGTIEFLLDTTRDPPVWYFLEMNTRLQVEHPVTESVTGVDLVKWQLRIAAGEPLDLSEEQTMAPRGHAIECRIYAEDADNGFLPSPGRIRALQVPSGPGVRDDSGARAGFEIPRFYDSMISKLIVHGARRPETISRLRRALLEYRVVGIRTTLPFFRWLVDQPTFLAGAFDTTYLDRLLAERRGQSFTTLTDEEEEQAAIAAAVASALEQNGAETGDRVDEAGSWRRLARAEGLR